MNRFLWAILLTSIIAAGCTHNSGTTSTDKIATADSSELLIDANSGATGLGVETIDTTKEAACNIVANFLNESKVYYFATNNGSKPHICPLGIFLYHENKIWFHVGKHKKSYTNLIKNPNVEIVSLNSTTGEWIRISGKAITSNNPVLDSLTFAIAPSLKEMYNEKTKKELGHFYIENGTAEISEKSTIKSFKF